MQSAMTLGGGSVASCVLMGSLLGYELLWVQPLAILLGFTVLAAVAKQTCHTGEKPYAAFWNRLHPALALLWGLSALIATIIWHFPQYSLSANGVVSLLSGVGIDIEGIESTSAKFTVKMGIGIALLSGAAWVVYLYGAGARGLRIYEMAVKTLVWLIVIAFAVVAFASGIDWGRFFMGVTGISFIQRAVTEGIPPQTIKPIVGGLAAAVGINMVFLYPYSILRKNWGKEYKELAYFDLMSGMVVPFLIATTFMIVATANTIGPEGGAIGNEVRNILELVPVLGTTFGEGLALALIGFGMLAVGFSTIITHMLASGFIGCEVFGFNHESKAKWWFSLLPAVGVLGVIYPFPWQMSVTASTLAFPLMPVAVICFIVLLNRADYMGDERPQGSKKLLWNGVLAFAVVFMIAAAGIALRQNWTELTSRLAEPEAAAEPAPAAAPAPPPQAAAAPPALGGPASPLHATFTHPAMGTDFEFTLYARTGEQDTFDLKRIAGEAFAAVDDLETRISSWRPDSQVSSINRRAAIEPVRVSNDVLDLIVYSGEVYRATDGAFDITLGPVLRAWGMYDGAMAMPGEAALAEALARSGYGQLIVDPHERTVAFAREGMALDFGGIGKGMALDTAAEVVKGYGVTAALLHGGTSTVVAIGAPPGKTGWTVRIRHPYNAEDWIDSVTLRDASVSTSGCYGRSGSGDEDAPCNILDPRTGHPVTGLLSATAVASTGIESDALSTAFLVLGDEGTRAYCGSHPEIAAIVVRVPSNGDAKPERINFPRENAWT